MLRLSFLVAAVMAIVSPAAYAADAQSNAGFLLMSDQHRD